MVPALCALPAFVGGLIIWKRARDASIKKLGAAIASIAVGFAMIAALLDLLPRLLA